MSLADITQIAVEAALQEFDALGKETFLDKYGFADAKRYWIIHNGHRYPSKAIAGVAHKYVAGKQLLPSASFTGGEGSVVRKLRQLALKLRRPAETRTGPAMSLSLRWTFTSPTPLPRLGKRVLPFMCYRIFSTKCIG